MGLCITFSLRVARGHRCGTVLRILRRTGATYRSCMRGNAVALELCKNKYLEAGDGCRPYHVTRAH